MLTPRIGSAQEPSVKIKRGASRLPMTVLVSMIVSTHIINVLRSTVVACWMVVKKEILACPRNRPIKNMVNMRLLKVGHMKIKQPPVNAVKVNSDC